MDGLFGIGVLVVVAIVGVIAWPRDTTIPLQEDENRVSDEERMANLSDIWVKGRAEVVRDREFRETAVGWNPGGWEEVEGDTPSGNREFSRVTKPKGRIK